MPRTTIASQKAFAAADKRVRVWGGRATAQRKQRHLGSDYYVETRSYGMFRPRAPTFPVLGCHSTGKLASRPPSTTPMAPPRRPQDCGTIATIRVVVGVRRLISNGGGIFKFLSPTFLKRIERWLTTDHTVSNMHRGGGVFDHCGLGTESRGPVAARTGQDVLARDRGGCAGLR